MKFKIPIEMKERRRYICINTERSKGELIECLERAINKIAGIKGALHKFMVISVARDTYLIKTTEPSVKAILTAILLLIYEDNRAINVIGISGTLRKARELCEHLL